MKNLIISLLAAWIIRCLPIWKSGDELLVYIGITAIIYSILMCIEDFVQERRKSHKKSMRQMR